MNTIAEEDKTPSQKRLYEMLRPLQRENNASLEYIHQLKSALEIDRRFRLVETLYTTIQSQVSSLEQKIACERVVSR